MKKTILWIFIALVSGIILSKVTLNSYKKVDTTSVIKYDENVYALKYKEYQNVDEMTEDITDIDRYIYIKNDNKVIVYLSLAKTKVNILKLKKIYDDKNIKTTIDEININNDEFISNLNEYEKLLSATDDKSSIMIIEKQILSCYTDLVADYE